MVLLVHETRSQPKTDEDRINLYNYTVAYSGRYTVEGDKIVHHVDTALNEGVTGTDLVHELLAVREIKKIRCRARELLAPIASDVLTRDPSRFRTRKKTHCPGQVLWFAHPTERCDSGIALFRTGH